jgi:hypothetical protein
MDEREDSPIEVTNENFGELLIAGLREALAVERGELEPARRVIVDRSDAIEPGGRCH